MGGLTSILHTTDLVIGYQSGKKYTRAIAGPLNLTLHSGELICLLGPNGCGKSTLIRTLAGLQDPLEGTIMLDGESLVQLKPAQVAKKISLVLTDTVRSGNLDVYTLISLGRYPYSGWLGILNEQDKKAIDYAVRVTDTSAFLSRKIDSLSDGECRKVMLARAIAQDTPLIILDEPTAHLDLPSRIQLMRLLHHLAKETRKSILISTHELDLALQSADLIWLMSSGGHLASGLPEELVLNGSFQQAFDKDGITFDIATGTFPLHQYLSKAITVKGEGAAAFWTKKALVRNGFSILANQNQIITVSGKVGELTWTVAQNGASAICHSISELLHALQGSDI